MNNDNHTPQIYVACLAAYNSGILYGAWIDADQPAEDIQQEVKAMLKASPIPDAEEWAIHDYDDFAGLRISEYEGFEQVSEKAAFVVEHGELGAELVNYYGGDLAEAREALEENYQGEWESLAEYAEDFTRDTQGSQIPNSLAYYIDYERMVRDMELSGDILTFHDSKGKMHIFLSR
jgi:antirestriction protein